MTEFPLSRYKPSSLNFSLLILGSACPHTLCLPTSESLQLSSLNVCVCVCVAHCTCLATLRASQYGLESSTARPILFTCSSSFTVASTSTARNRWRQSYTQIHTQILAFKLINESTVVILHLKAVVEVESGDIAVRNENFVVCPSSFSFLVPRGLILKTLATPLIFPLVPSSGQHLHFPVLNKPQLYFVLSANLQKLACQLTKLL